jgi:hypothetical protein
VITAATAFSPSWTSGPRPEKARERVLAVDQFLGPRPEEPIFTKLDQRYLDFAFAPGDDVNPLNKGQRRPPARPWP